MRLKFAAPSPYADLGDHLLRCISLNRPLNEGESHRLLLPARLSAERLRTGAAEIGDLHNLAAFTNVGSMLAHRAGEAEAMPAIQAGLLAVCAVKDRGGPRYAMNTSQREAILQAVQLTDELFCCCTLLEIDIAHRKILDALPLTGEMKAVEVEL